MRTLFLSLVLSVFCSTTVMAGSIVSDVKHAIELSKNGNSAESMSVMRDVTADLWLQSPLAFTEALFVTGDAPLYGAFEPRNSNVFKEGEPVFVYAEPIGYGWRQNGDYFETDLGVDAALLSPEGTVLWSQKSFGNFDLTSRKRFMEYMMNLELDITGLPAGSFVLEYTVTDRIGGNSAVISLPFVRK